MSLEARTDDLKNFMTASLHVANGHPSLTLGGLKDQRVMTDSYEVPPGK